ncbi:cupin domain-containing protein [Hydrogenophaga sp. SL48]|uniref:cupin domain-containing protein n=1 Tax=Hydrogenophaga sp. SL48 TaxID=2806347 RepID=UPI001F3A5871|nr:cupin domain-containing protein [Hydrogenophaga sp. SL48]UJW81224.1 cupin domain-containing protein [Hydrogenophaga sp. SL48]
MASDTFHGVPVALQRVVTGHDTDGESCFVQQSAPPRTDAYTSIPGMVSRLVWATGSQSCLPHDDEDPTLQVSNFVPNPGETRFLIVTFPPDSVFASPDFNEQAAIQENLALSPGLAERFEPDGMHATPTIDYCIVLDGEIWLELDGGRASHLRQHDVAIQNGTRHAWRNKSNRSATLAFVLIGAQSAR